MLERSNYGTLNIEWTVEYQLMSLTSPDNFANFKLLAFEFARKTINIAIAFHNNVLVLGTQNGDCKYMNWAKGREKPLVRAFEISFAISGLE